MVSEGFCLGLNFFLLLSISPCSFNLLHVVHFLPFSPQQYPISPYPQTPLIRALAYWFHVVLLLVGPIMKTASATSGPPAKKSLKFLLSYFCLWIPVIIKLAWFTVGNNDPEQWEHGHKQPVLSYIFCTKELSLVGTRSKQCRCSRNALKVFASNNNSDETFCKMKHVE